MAHRPSALAEATRMFRGTVAGLAIETLERHLERRLQSAGALARV